MRYFFKTARFKVLLGIAGGIIVMMIVVRALGGWAAPQSGIIGAIVTPVQRFASDVSTRVKGVFGVYGKADRLEQENARLRKELQEAVAKIVDYDLMKNENAQLKEFYGIKEEHPDFDLEPARAVSIDPEDAFGAFTIDSGSMKGISPGDPVVSAEGALVGRILEVAPTFSKVVTILAPQPEMSASAIDSRTMDAGSVYGSLELAQKGLTKISTLSRKSAVAVGDLIITSGVGGMYPKGLVIGTVEEIRQETQNISKYATIRPAARLDGLMQVMVVKSFDGQK